MGKDNLAEALRTKILGDAAMTMIDSLSHDEMIELLKPSVITAVQDATSSYKFNAYVEEKILERARVIVDSPQFSALLDQKAIQVVEVYTKTCVGAVAKGLYKMMRWESLTKDLERIAENATGTKP